MYINTRVIDLHISFSYISFHNAEPVFGHLAVADHQGIFMHFF
jgi:hypothetical protein